MPLSPRDRRTLMIGGGIMAAILVAFILFNVVVNGSTGANPSFAPIGSGVIPSGGPSVAPSGSGSPSVLPTVPPPQNFTGRDPFSVPPQLQPSPTTTGGGGSGSTPPPTSGSNPPPTSGTPPPSNPGGGSSIVIGGHTVVLLDTFERGGAQRAQVEVDGAVYNVAVGSTFASGAFELRSASSGCATFLFGDQPFSLCATASK
jgi:hypothetical protein